MTFLITITFLARSSSLVAWVPLAIAKIIENYNFLIPILTAGITVAIPVIFVSIYIDSYFYGTFTVP
jgi:hypothetical protein